MKKPQGRPFEYKIRPAVGGGFVGVHVPTGTRATALTARAVRAALKERVHGAVDRRRQPSRLLRATEDQWARWDVAAERSGKSFSEWARDLLDAATL